MSLKSSFFLGLGTGSNEEYRTKLLVGFQDASKELSYQNFQRPFRIQYLRSIIIFFLISIVFLSIFHHFEQEDDWATYLVWFVINILLLLIIFPRLGIRNKKIPPQIAITVLQIYLSINWVEFFLRRKNPMNSNINLILGLLLELVMLGPVLSNCSPISSMISSLLPNIYLGIRLLKVEENPRLLGLTICLLILNSIFISIWSCIRDNYCRQNFSQHKNMETMLQQYKEVVKEILPSAIVIFENDNIVFFNEETSKLLRVNSKYELEQRFREIIIDERALNEIKNAAAPKNNYEPVNMKSESEILCLFDLICLNKGTYKEQKKFYSYSGTLESLADLNSLQNLPRNYEIKVGPMIWEGRESYMIVISEDRTLERLEFLTKLSRNKDDMLATVSHDLRSPLNAIIAIIETVLEELASEELKKSLEIALGSSKLLLYLINDILDFTQIEHGKLRIQPSRFDIVETIRETIKLMKLQAKKKGIDLKFLNLFPFSEQPLLFNDPNRLRQIILNLVGNALKFTEKGSIYVSVGPLDEQEAIGSEVNKELRSVKVSVQDTGHGIKEEDLPKLFNRFGKLDDQSKINTQGVGLGLEISQSLVKEMNLNIPGEEIKVFSEFGKGSVFSFNLHSMPFEEEDAQQKKYVSSKKIKELSQFIFSPLEESPNELSIPQFKVNNVLGEKFTIQPPLRRVLLVDDDQINLMVFKMYLKGSPEFQYDCAFDGKQALEAVIEAASRGIYYDIILMDYNMPLMNGWEAAEKILVLEKEMIIPKVRIIALTANASKNEHMRCLNIGMADYWTKPIRKAEFIQNLKKVTATL